MKPLFAIAFLSVGLGLVAGCSGVAPVEEQETATETSEDALVTKKLVGNYTYGNEGWLQSLNLNADGSFTGSQIVTCIKAPCNPIAISGKWSTLLGYLRLTQGSTSQSYSYTLKGDDLRLYRNQSLYAHVIKSTIDACSVVRCASGTKCEVQGDGTAKCVKTSCPSGQSLQLCWGSMQCIPNGAIC